MIYDMIWFFKRDLLDSKYRKRKGTKKGDMKIHGQASKSELAHNDKETQLLVSFAQFIYQTCPKPPSRCNGDWWGLGACDVKKTRIDRSVILLVRKTRREKRQTSSSGGRLKI